MAKKSSFKGHGNEKCNPKPHHLYEIVDKTDDSVYKYGISAGLIDEEGYSYRMRRQVDIGNSFVGWLRFFARILLRNIQGREKAEKIEKDHIDTYKEEHGHTPRGNFE